MRKTTLVLLVVLVLTLSLGAFAFQKESEGFRGLKWGDPPTKDMVFIRRDEYGENQYELPDENLQIGEVELERIIYYFFDDGNSERLMSVIIRTEGKHNYELLKELCKLKFGEEVYEESSRRIIWASSKTLVHLAYDQYYSKYRTVVNGYLLLSYLPIGGEYQKAKEDVLRESMTDDW